MLRDDEVWHTGTGVAHMLGREEVPYEGHTVSMDQEDAEYPLRQAREPA
jgi:hypothetical protein